MTVSETKIEWTDFSVNFWEGCQKVGPGCDNCYAEARDIRFTGGSHWGPGAPRRKVKGGIAKLRKIEREAEEFLKEKGHLPRVFCSSLSDIFDKAIDHTWRIEAFKEIEGAWNCQIQLVTKRVGNVEKMVPDIWRLGCWPDNVGLMITVVNQEEADCDIPKLLDLKARLGIPWVGLSVEPMLGPINLARLTNGDVLIDCLQGYVDRPTATPGLREHIPTGRCVDWVICGGESGSNARPMHPVWATDLASQCEAASVPFLFKQWGRWLHESQDPNGLWDWDDANDRGILFCWDDDPATFSIPLSKTQAGRLLDGIEHNGFPKALT